MNHCASIVLLVCSLPLNGGRAFAQQWTPSDASAVTEFMAQNDRQYAALVNMKLTTTIQAFKNAGDVFPNDRGSSVVWKTGDRYKAEHLGMVTYQDQEMCLQIDPEERTIMVSTSMNLLTTMRGAMVDSLLRHALVIGRAFMADGTHFRLKFGADAVYDVVELVFDQKGWLRKEEIYWGRPVELNPGDPTTEVVYPKVVFAMAVPESIDASSVDTDLSDVLIWQDGKPVALGRWKGYDIFDTRPR